MQFFLSINKNKNKAKRNKTSRKFKREQNIIDKIVVKLRKEKKQKKKKLNENKGCKIRKLLNQNKTGRKRNMNNEIGWYRYIKVTLSNPYLVQYIINVKQKKEKT